MTRRVPKNHATGAERPRLVHAALCHDTASELVDAVAPFVEEGIGRTEPVFVNLSGVRNDALARKLGPRSPTVDKVHWTDAQQWYPHPARRIRAMARLFLDLKRSGAHHVRFVTEGSIPLGSCELVEEWSRADAVYNDAFAFEDLSLVCAYDASMLPTAVIDRARETHPLLGITPPHESQRFTPPDRFLASRARQLAPVPASAHHRGPDATPSRARSLVQDVVRAARRDGQSLDDGAVEDLALAVTEIVANSWQAGATRVDVWCWNEEGGLAVEVVDNGPGWDDPLAGYHVPRADAPGGRGLWIVRQVADVTEIRSGPQGSAVRVHVRAPAVDTTRSAHPSPVASRG